MSRYFLMLYLIPPYLSVEISANNFSMIPAYESIFRMLPKLSHSFSARSFRGPQSLSILMNFDPDGTSSIHLLNNANGVYWSDSGNCQHGQMYDPMIGCREIFCMEGYTLDANGCVKDTNYNKSNTPPHKASPEMRIELTIVNKMCTLKINQTNCSTQSLTSNINFVKNFQTLLSEILSINFQRIQNLEIVYQKISVQEDKINSTIKQSLIESIKIIFCIKDKFNTSEKETIQLYFTLVVFAIEQYPIKFQNNTIKLSQVMENDNKLGYFSWCNQKGDVKTYIVNNFRILVSFEPIKQYFVYSNLTNKFYGSGYFFLTILFKTKDDVIRNSEHTLEHFESSYNTYDSWSTDFSKLNYSDVTDFIIDRTNPSLDTSAFLTICDRAPKIRVYCNNYTTIRVRKCEFFYHEHNKSYCWTMFKNKCYSIDEYEYDRKEPDKFIRICQYIPNNTIHLSYLNNVVVKLKEQSLTIKISSWFSMIANITSLICMILTLITYTLFKELRNIPGCNIINLTLALSFAQGSFFMGSFFSNIDMVCFLIAIFTHYGFLASFFWMNVIAFDLYRNFKSAHVLLLSQRVCDRLPFYAVYAWLCPLSIVLLGLVIDFTVREPSFQVPFRPCYARYLSGCDIVSNKWPVKTQCEADNIVTRSCWIQNGRANLVFFGIPIGLIILANGVYLFLTIYNIRIQKRKLLQNKLRRVSRFKLPGDEEIRFYIQMACIMGFTWISGFLLATNTDNNNVLEKILLFLFILSNGFTGVFIFVVFICRKNVKNFYLSLFKKRFSYKSEKIGVSVKSSKNMNGSNLTIASVLESERHFQTRVNYANRQASSFEYIIEESISSNKSLDSMNINNKY
ncbi:unnamed protein product [Brachionus calyciflorus]|uniref:G-protein coupled receptors family 2 profile 2 domain-containing protein n=1 Tax=Brachionus calyciflorus TaxID=104777 RepID=A0A813UX48_9BILA|nr:unnamed protein product [Brachionus calyciflorus]